MMYDSDEDFIYPKPSTKTKTETKTKDNTKDIIKTKPITYLKLKLKIVSTPELSLNVENVMQNLEFK